MDPLTHAVMGATVAAFVAQEEDMRRAALVGAVAGVLPDLDVLISDANDPLLQLETHRQFSHSLLMAPVIGAVVAVAARFMLKSTSIVRLWTFATLAVLSACLLDAGTSYGTQLLWPFNTERIAWNVVAVVDPVFTLLVIVSLVVLLLRRSGTIAAVGVALAGLYLVSASVQNQRAEWAVRSLADQRAHTIEAIHVKPTIANQIVWRSVYKADGRFWVDAVRTGIFVDILAYPGGSIAMLQSEDTANLTDRQKKDLERFSVLSNHFIVQHPNHPRVFGDARYAMNPDGIAPLWGIELADTRVHDAEVIWRTFREFDDRDRYRFMAMIMGNTLEPREFIPTLTTEK